LNGLPSSAFNEACDDGNPSNLDQCNVTCGLTRCGDGFVQVLNGFNQNEQCDDGNLNNGDGCSSTCQMEACGNGFINPGEFCDTNNLNGQSCQFLESSPGVYFSGGSLACYPSTHALKCQFNTAGCCRCGNGIPESACSEQCDDGNTNNNDACDNSCISQTSNCPTGGSSPDSYTGCRASQPGNSSLASAYTCLSGQTCYVCNAGYRWLGDPTNKCDPISAACGYPPTNNWAPGYTAHCGGIFNYTFDCVKSTNINYACCSGTIENPDWNYDYELPIVPY
jgi:cysteine-rich repeat protein